MQCEYCNSDALYKCTICGRLLCGEHSKLRIVCASCAKKTTFEYMIKKVSTSKERESIRKFVRRFWGEQEQLTFGKRFIVTGLRAYAAKVKNVVVGFVSYAEADGTIIIVALGILPKYQGSGIGKNLIEKVEDEAKRFRKRKLIVSTSNDDLPALAFYQSLGFQIYEVKPNAIAEKHGKILKGTGGLSVRDELRLQKILHQ